MSLRKPQDLIGEEDEIVFSLPAVYVELQKALNDPDKTFQNLGDIIGFDTALSARLLKIANSPFYGFPSKIDKSPMPFRSSAGINSSTSLYRPW